MTPGRRAAFYTLGCRLNQAETALIEDRLQAAGYTVVPYGEPVDLCIVNTCTVTQEADAKSRKMIRACIRANPDAFVAVIGCYAQVAAETLAGIPGVDLVLGNQHKLQLVDYVKLGKNAQPQIVCDAISAEDFVIGACEGEGLSRRINLKIQDGCDCQCAYCIIPTARGPARSRDYDDLIEEAALLAGRGVRELVLSGVNVGAYRFGARTLVDVVDGLNAISGLARVRIGSIEMTAVPEALLERMADTTHILTPHLHLPLQSGSDHVLAAMQRPYTMAEYCDFTEQACKRVSDLTIGADIMVGFPGETEDDVADTLAVLRDCPIAYAHVFQYSDRKGTVAQRRSDKIAPPIMEVRSCRVRDLATRKRQEFHVRHLGKCLTVLFEEKQGDSWFGYTGNYLRVGVCCPDNQANLLATVRLQEDRGEYVSGVLENGEST